MFISVGHGNSEGERVQIRSFDIYVRDVFHHVDKVTASNAGLPIFLFGHSMVSKLVIVFEPWGHRFNYMYLVLLTYILGDGVPSHVILVVGLALQSCTVESCPTSKHCSVL